MTEKDYCLIKNLISCRMALNALLNCDFLEEDKKAQEWEKMIETTTRWAKEFSKQINEKIE